MTVIARLFFAVTEFARELLELASETYLVLKPSLRAWRLVTLTFACIALVANQASCGPLKVMPLGDSNTSGTFYARGAYRLQLWKRFGSDPNRLEFIGSTGHPLPVELGSKWHEGHSGFTIAASPSTFGNITDNIARYLDSTRNPNIILMMIGTNDINFNYSVEQAPARLDNLISLISDRQTGLKPRAKLIVGNLPPIDDAHNNFRSSANDFNANARIAAFNATIPGIVAAHRARGEQVYFADINSSLSLTDIQDGLHLTSRGYDKLGDAWLSAIRSLPEPSGLTLALYFFAIAVSFRNRRNACKRDSKSQATIAVIVPQCGEPIVFESRESLRAASHVRRVRCARIWQYRTAAVGMAIVIALYPGGPAVAAPTFTNVTASVGLSHTHTVGTSLQFMSAGASAADFDGDGLVDLFFTQANDTPKLYRNTGGSFEDISIAAGFTDLLATSGVAAGDIDNDGDLDLSLMGMQASRNYLFINDGGGHFSEDAVARGADIFSDSPSRRGQGVAFGDYDRDGYLDMMTSEHSRPIATSGSRLLRNLGAANPGHFEDVTQAAGLDVYRSGLHDSVTAYRFQPQFTDLDRDGNTDIVITGDDRTSQLFWNNGDGTFTDGTIPAGVGTDKSGMGSALGDYDGDGDLDWFITAIFDTTFLGVNPGNRLYRNNGNRTFTDVTTAAGVRNSGSGVNLSWGWGATFLDYDNDTDQDLMMTNGCNAGCSSVYLADQTTLRRNNGDGTFTDVSAAAGISDTGQGRGLLRLDYDSDGDLDTLVVNYGAAPILYRNDGGNDFDWLRVKTVGTISNSNGIGALVTVTPDMTNPTDSQIWEVGSGSSYLSQDEMTAHFGLGTFPGTIDLVTIQWPSGILQEFFDVTPNTLLIAREALLGDFNGDLVVDGLDLVNWQSEFGTSGGTLTADADYDTDVDGLDYLIWQRNFGISVLTTLMAATSVPEPTSAVLILVSGLVLGSLLRSRS